MTETTPNPDKRREQWRRAAEKQRLKRGIAPVKGTVIECAVCREPFTRNSVKAVRCKPCQRADYLARARASSAKINEARGYRKIGDAAVCRRCSEPFTLTAGKQAQCPACRALPDHKRWTAVAANRSANSRAHYYRDHERTKRRQREARERRKADPAFTINERMSAGVRYSLAAGKQGSSWEALVGYTKDALVAHLEKQFLPGMSWDRREEFHIDHIIPLASFRFETADDPEFRAAWALSNLRPLWAIDNITKNDRRTHLL
jgi:hypothetical protein